MNIFIPSNGILLFLIVIVSIGKYNSCSNYKNKVTTMNSHAITQFDTAMEQLNNVLNKLNNNEEKNNNEKNEKRVTPLKLYFSFQLNDTVNKKNEDFSQKLNALTSAINAAREELELIHNNKNQNINISTLQ